MPRVVIACRRAHGIFVMRWPSSNLITLSVGQAVLASNAAPTATRRDCGICVEDVLEERYVVPRTTLSRQRHALCLLGAFFCWHLPCFAEFICLSLNYSVVNVAFCLCVCVSYHYPVWSVRARSPSSDVRDCFRYCLHASCVRARATYCEF